MSRVKKCRMLMEMHSKGTSWILLWRARGKEAIFLGEIMFS